MQLKSIKVRFTEIVTDALHCVKYADMTQLFIGNYPSAHMVFGTENHVHTAKSKCILEKCTQR